MSAHDPLTNERASLCECARQMSDAELVTAAEEIRGTAKRGSRRRLTEAETLTRNSS